MTRRSLHVRPALLILGLVGMGCAHAPPAPQELTDARAAYQRAIQGPAVGADPVRLGLARHALDEAEQTYQMRGNMQDVRDQAYVSLRFTQTAEAQAAVNLLEARRQRAVGELATLQERQRNAERERQVRAAAQTAEATKAAKAAAAEAAREPATVLFGTNEATLNKEAMKVLNQEVPKLKAAEKPVVVEGHTDSTGNAAYNQDLSERRAQSVRDYLVAHGVKESEVTVEAAGPDQPAATNSTEEGRAENRRVEVQLAPAGTAPHPVTTPLSPEFPSP